MTSRNSFGMGLTFGLFALASLATQTGCSLAPNGQSGNPTPQYQAVTATQARDLIQSHAGDPNFMIIDVRSPSEFAAGHIAGAVNMNVNGSSPSFSDAVSALDKSWTYFVYCGSQHRSPTAITIMQQQGFLSLYELTGGLAQWQAAGLPVVQ